MIPTKEQIEELNQEALRLWKNYDADMVALEKEFEAKKEALAPKRDAWTKAEAAFRMAKAVVEWSEKDGGEG